MPLTMTDELPPTSPAFAIGLPGTIASISTPCVDRTWRRSRATGRCVSPSSPSHGCATWPCCSSCGDHGLRDVDRDREADADVAVHLGVARSCALMPITAPERSISGPPELPWLIAASVCSALSIAKSFGAEIWRWMAEMMPAVSVRSSPNGLPIATTESPTSTVDESPSGSGCSAARGQVDLEHGEIGRGVRADDLRLARCRCSRTRRARPSGPRSRARS